MIVFFFVELILIIVGVELIPIIVFPGAVKKTIERARVAEPGPAARYMSAFTRTIYTESPTFLGMLLECTQYIDRCRHDPTCSKEDVLDSMENRLSLLVGKMAAYPTSASFQVLLDPPPAKASASTSGARPPPA